MWKACDKTTVKPCNTGHIWGNITWNSKVGRVFYRLIKLHTKIYVVNFL